MTQLKSESSVYERNFAPIQKSEALTAATVQGFDVDANVQERIRMNITIETSVAAIKPHVVAPELTVVNGHVMTTSRQIAEHFSKRHGNVLRDIARILSEAEPEFAERNFALSEFTDGTGRKLPMYQMTRDGFVLLAMGFTGKEATAWKIAYLKTFNKMEAELLGKAERAPYSVAPHQALSAENAEALRLTLTQFCEKLPTQDQKAKFMRVGWSKLSSHFKCSYRSIPNSQFAEAMSIVARHIVEFTPEPEVAKPAPGSMDPHQVQRAKARIDAVAMALQSFPARGLTREGQCLMHFYAQLADAAASAVG